MAEGRAESAKRHYREAGRADAAALLMGPADTPALMALRAEAGREVEAAAAEELQAR
jgi:hypothetical protein